MARLDDGHPTTIVFTAAPTSGLLLFEKEVTPPGLSGGGANDTTTMLNTVFRTMSPKKLKSLAEMSFVAAFDPAYYDLLVAILNVNDLITITFPDNSTLAFFGWIDELSHSAIVEGEQPTIDITVIPSNQNLAGAETAPVFTP